MRCLVRLLAAVVLWAGAAGAQPFGAGVARMAVPDVTPFEVLVAYPTHAADGAIALGPFTVPASHETAVAPGTRFPVVIFSHGSGRGPGTPLMHRGLLLHLARQGFVVVAPFHPGTARPFADRPRHVRRAFEHVLGDRRFAPHVDPARLAMMGFSFGGAVTLLSAGAMLDLQHLATYCRGRPDDPRACDGIPADDSLTGVPARGSPDALAIKALVLFEPFGAPFQGSGLASVDVPVLIYRALQSDLRAAGNALALARNLPKPPQQAEVPGSHFVFVDPCPAALAEQAPQICADPAGVDRAAVQARVKREVTAFLRAAFGR